MPSPQMSRPQQLLVESLEDRAVPAGMSLEPLSKVLTVTGDRGADFALIRHPQVAITGESGLVQGDDLARIEVTITTDTGYQQTRTFDRNSVDAIHFNGKDGADVLVNNTKLVVTKSTSTSGTISASVVAGSPDNANPADRSELGVVVVGTTGEIEVDYLYAGAGYRGQLALYSLEGMEAYQPGSVLYIAEATNRALTKSDLGTIVIDRRIEGARFGAVLPWEGNLNSGPYMGPKAFTLKPGGQYGVILVPNGTLRELAANPAAGGSLRPLFSIPAANPYPLSPQMLGQMGDVTGTGTTFAFEDQRLDGGSDRDYNDMVFQISGARATATPIREVINPGRDFASSQVGIDLIDYAQTRQADDPALTTGFTSGSFIIGSSGRVSAEFLFDSGGYIGQLGVFSLQGMGRYEPGSVEFIREAARRVLSGSTLGHQLIDDTIEGARFAATAPLMRSFNQGSFLGSREVEMIAGDQVGFMLMPNGSFWQAFSAPTTDGIHTPLFSLPDANPDSAYGRDHFAQLGPGRSVFAFEDVRLDTTGVKASDRDFNDIVFRVTGLMPQTKLPTVSDLAGSGRDWSFTPLGVELLQID